MFVFGQRSRLMLVGVHPDLVLVVSRALLYSPIDFAVTEGLRDAERQRKLFAEGRSKTLRSKHLAQSPAGLSDALDVMATGDLNNDSIVDHKDRAIAWRRDWYEAIADAMLRASTELRIPTKWGGTFRGFYDGPHFQLGG